MPHFSLKVLLLATTFVAVGIGMLCSVFSPAADTIPDIVALTMFFTSGPLIGAGLFIPFNKTWIGAIIGAAVSAVLYYLPLLLQIH